MSRLWKDRVVAAGLVTALIACSGGSGNEGPITGTVLGPDGKPAVGAMLNLEWLEQEEADPLAHDWTSYRAEGSMAGFDGSFTIPDPGSDRRVAMVVHHRDFAVHQREVTDDRTGVEVRLEKPWALKGSISWDTDLDLDYCLVMLHEENGLRLPLTMHDIATVTNGKDLMITRMTSGTYTLKVTPMGGGTLLYSRPVELKEGGGRLDLGAIDLRGKVTKAVLRLESETGPVETFSLAVDPEGNAIAHGETSEITMHFAEASMDLGLWVDGFRPQLLEGVQGVRTVRLEPGIPVVVELDPTPELPEGVVAMLELSNPEEAEEGVIDFRTPMPFYLEQGQGHVSTPGSYRARIVLRTPHQDARAAALPIPLPPLAFLTTLEEAPLVEILDQEQVQTLRIPVDAKALQDAIVRLESIEPPEGRR